MKNSPSHNNLQALIIALGFFTVSAFTTAPALAKTKLNTQKVFYKGEWITRVSMPEINIMAERIPTNDKVPFLKRVETVFENGVKTLHITMNDINISSNDNSSNGFESVNSENNVEDFSPLNEKIPSIDAPSQPEITPAINTGNKANDKISVEQKNSETSEFAKRPVFNKILNKLVNAGIAFLTKVNDGLFFKS